MSFTKQLFEMTSMALPDVTARTFSRYLGKSEGYYGSITAQNLDISTNSLLFLSELLDQKSSNNPNKRITELQSMIAQEVARRMQTLETQNIAVRKLVMKSIARAYINSDGIYVTFATCKANRQLTVSRLRNHPTRSLRVKTCIGL